MIILRTALLLAALSTPAVAQSPALLDHPDAFERGFAVSFYMFDACGDALAGRMYRRALAERFAQCPFTPEARTRYQQRTRAQQARTRDKMSELIDHQGGLPVQLDGMPKTCHAQQADQPYKDYRDKLERYAAGTLTVDAVIAAPCDAPDLTP